MSHPAQRDFCKRVRDLWPAYFAGKRVLDVGSLDINGNNRWLFEDCAYTGLDLGPGPNVTAMGRAHLFTDADGFDVIISCEALEHDKYWRETLLHCARDLLKPGGLYLLTCAGPGRPVHGLADWEPASSPFTHDYYENRTREELEYILTCDYFRVRHFEVNKSAHDLYFWGIK